MARLMPDPLIRIHRIGAPGGGIVTTAPETQLADAFTAANGTDLSVYNDHWVKHALDGVGNAVIDANRVHNTNDTNIHAYYRDDWTPASADYAVECDVVSLTHLGGSCAVGP